MKISIDVLRRYTTLPQSPKEIRSLLDDIGIEVKRQNGDQLSLELLANRGDHHCYAGIAREIHGRSGSGVTTPELSPLQLGAGPLPLQVETDLGLVYTATLLERDPDAEDTPLPAEVLAVLEAAEIKSTLPPVDATNLSNMELGQPTHVFDADKITGGITVRLSRAGEKAWPLFTEGHIPLPEGTLVIADDEKILAIAGVIGCEDSKTTAESTRIVLESAAFDPVAVRKAHRALNIHTDAAARFERGSDPTAPLQGAGRVVYLLERHAGWRRVGTTGMAGAWVDPGRHIRLNAKAANAFLDTDMPVQEIVQRLERYGFALTIQEGDDLIFNVPPHRLWDVEFTADLYEELAKSVGYNNTPHAIPPVGMGALPSAAEEACFQTEEVLLGQGFYEVITDGFYSQQVRDRLGADQADHPLHAHVQTLNSLERGYSLLKNNALGQAIEAADKNLRMRMANFKMYEWTRTFHPVEDDGLPTERSVLWLLTCGAARPRTWAEPARPADPLYLKGLLSEIATTLSLPLTLQTSSGADPLSRCLHPNRQAEIWLHGRRVGVLGEVHPAIVQNFRIKRARPCYLEIERSALEQKGQPPRYSEPSAHQPIVRSLAFALPSSVMAGEVCDVLEANGPDWLKQISMTDLFAFEEDGTPLRAVTYELVYGNDEGDRSADDVNACTESLAAVVHDVLGNRGVRQRV